MKFNLNLASRRYVNKRALYYGFVTALCILFLFGGWEVSALIASNNALQLNQQRLVEAKKKLQVLQGGPTKTLSIQERALLEKESSVVADLLALDAFRWTELLDRMENLLPKGVSLNSFRPDYKKKSLNLNGNARTLKDMRIFLDRLLKNENFEQVYLKSHSRIKVKDYADIDRDAISFSLQLEGVF